MARIRYQQPVESFPLFVARVVLVGAVIMYFAWQLAHARGLPIVLIILAVLVLVYGLLTRRTVFGRQVYAIGGNLSAATLSGVKVRSVNFWIFVNMGFLAGRGRGHLLLAVQRRAARRRQHVRARRDRRGVHRWRGGRRRRRHGRRAPWSVA